MASYSALTTSCEGTLASAVVEFAIVTSPCTVDLIAGFGNFVMMSCVVANSWVGSSVAAVAVA